MLCSEVCAEAWDMMYQFEGARKTAATWTEAWADMADEAYEFGDLDEDGYQGWVIVERDGNILWGVSQGADEDEWEPYDVISGSASSVEEGKRQAENYIQNGWGFQGSRKKASIDDYLSLVDPESGREWEVAFIPADTANPYAPMGSTYDDDCVAFFDATGNQYFGASYFVDTFMEHQGGLSLMGGEPVWSLSADAVNQVKGWLKGRLGWRGAARKTAMPWGFDWWQDPMSGAWHLTVGDFGGVVNEYAVIANDPGGIGGWTWGVEDWNAENPIDEYGYLDEGYGEPTFESAKRRVENAITDLMKRSIAKRKTAMPNPVDLGVSVGDIFYSSWGYEQTNISWYEVTGLTGASVKVREIRGEVVSGFNSPSEEVMPLSGVWRDDEMTKRIKDDGWQGVPSIKINDYETAWLWDGSPKYQTGAAWGH